MSSIFHVIKVEAAYFTNVKCKKHYLGNILCCAGTTCATVLTQAIYAEGCKSIASGINVMDLRSGIMMAVDAVISNLKSRATMISTPEEIVQVTIPNNN